MKFSGSDVSPGNWYMADCWPYNEAVPRIYPRNHLGGANVLSLDGHVKHVPFASLPVGRLGGDQVINVKIFNVLDK